VCLSADRLTCLDREGSLVGVGGTLYGERGSSCNETGRPETLPNEETVKEGDETEEGEIEERVEVWLLRAAILREVSEQGRAWGERKYLPFVQRLGGSGNLSLFVWGLHEGNSPLVGSPPERVRTRSSAWISVSSIKAKVGESWGGVPACADPRRPRH
jgi:hypothetical protein